MKRFIFFLGPEYTEKIDGTKQLANEVLLQK